MWMLHFIPDSFLHLVVLAILGSGVALYVLGLFINLAPPTFRLYKEPIRILSTILIVAGVYFYGSYDTEMQWREKVAEVQKQLAEAEAKSEKVNVQIQTKIVTQKQIVHDTQVVIQDRIIKEAAKMDAECKVAPEAIKDLNDAARNPFGGKK